MPARIAKLPIDERGYPVPWFVTWIDGKPEFRVADGEKLARAVNENRCWVCGQTLGHTLAFTIGPMCAVNRISAEPPAHRECAEFSARACPFLSRPHMRRRENDLPEEAGRPAGHMIRRNPGVALIWLTKQFRIVRDRNGRPLFGLGDPRECLWFAEGRRATIDEIRESVESGLPILRETAKAEGTGAEIALERQIRTAAKLFGFHPNRFTDAAPAAVESCPIRPSLNSAAVVAALAVATMSEGGR